MLTKGLISIMLEHGMYSTMKIDPIAYHGYKETIQTLEEIIEELYDRLFKKCSEIFQTPFFMFKRVIRLKAEIKQLKSVISLIRGYL